MPRIARAVAVNFPHHVTQRGNYQQKVFNVKTDYLRYLAWFRKYSREVKLETWAYCLMPNHVHFIVVPRESDSMAKLFNQAHARYAQYFNEKKLRKGHLWQSRFYSCLLDEEHLFAAIRYVERNPVRAGIVNKAEDYPWSSASAHLNKKVDKIITTDCYLTKEISDWVKYLSSLDEEKIIESIRANTRTGRPAGNEEFISKIEGILGRVLTAKPRGRPKTPDIIKE